ncbi:hypothetical protein HUT18_18775 [Streptomyces sp. NA04227]|uniref:hypothetical protein n=1 Tax=Streptomyces sp. NA04227 TaxID=2742136 RepID=UPI0015900081|nr:hypothetical protein [Streptomyces sp. NA04227]QKW08122.1 hypothetical protein HUT18_18775 [Streptomyces sp. NA04227]
MSNDVFVRLAELDPAPRTPLTTAEADRRERLLHSVLDETTAAQRPARPAPAWVRRPLVRRTSFALAGVLAAAALVLTTTSTPSDEGGSGPLSPAEVGAWTETATAVTSADSGSSVYLEYKCLQDTKKVTGDYGPGHYSNADLRGSTVSVIITRRGQSAYCLAGRDGTGTVVPVDPPTPVRDTGVTLDTFDSSGDGSARFAYAIGSVGAEVKSVTLHADGRTVKATVGQIPSLPYGRWSAWWPSTGEDGPVTLTLTLADGTTRTLGADRL